MLQINLKPGARITPQFTGPSGIVCDGAENVLVLDEVETTGAHGYLVKMDDGERYWVHATDTTEA